MSRVAAQLQFCSTAFDKKHSVIKLSY